MNDEFNEQSSESTQRRSSSSSEFGSRKDSEGGRIISSRWDLEETWADLEAATPRTVEEGDIVTGTVIEIQDQGVVVDVGAKCEGIIPRSEFAGEVDLPQCDQEVEVAVISVDDDTGAMRLSKTRADYERVWRRIYDALENEKLITAMVTDRVKGGLRVDLGVSGFVPASHVATRDVRRLDNFVGRTLRLKVLEADRAANKVILSHRQVIEEERKRRREATMARLKEGVVCEGKVRNLTDYGAFIDLGGVDGLLHISEISWTHIDHASEVLKTGEIIRVMVLTIEKDGERISLGRRQILPDPWKELSGQVHEGDSVQVHITRIVSTGAFARLADTEIEGFIPIRHMSSKHIDSPDDVLEKGQQIQVKILELNPQARKMVLSLAAAQQVKERQAYEQHIDSEQQATVTLGDQFGEVLEEARAHLEAAGPEPAAESDDSAAEQPAAAEDVDSDEPPEESETIAEDDQEEAKAHLEAAGPEPAAESNDSATEQPAAAEDGDSDELPEESETITEDDQED